MENQKELKKMELADAKVTRLRATVLFLNRRGYVHMPGLPQFDTQEDAVAFAKEYIRQDRKVNKFDRLMGYKVTQNFLVEREVPYYEEGT